MLRIKQLKGRVNYLEALNKMNSKVLDVSEDIKNEEIWFLEHQSVFTAGSSTPKNFNEKKINNIPVVFINRGGKITFHGPGQLIIYPILNIKNVVENKKGKLKNKTFMFTGKLLNISRAEAKSLTEENSGKILSNVSKKLDYLVIGEKPTSKKVKQAKELNIKVINQEEWKTLLN